MEVDMPFIIAALIIFGILGFLSYLFIFAGTREPSPKPKGR